MLVATAEEAIAAYASFGNPIDMTANVIFDPALMAGTVRDVVESGEYDAVDAVRQPDLAAGCGAGRRACNARRVADAIVGVAWIAGKPSRSRGSSARACRCFRIRCGARRAIAARLRWEAERDEAAADCMSSAPPAAPARTSRVSLRRNRCCAVTASRSRRAAWPRTSPRRNASRIVSAIRSRESSSRAISRTKARSAACISDIDSDAALGRALAALDAIAIADKEGILDQKMIDGGLEVFVGMKRDEVFGPVVVVGLGGIYVEILRETVMRLAPFDDATAERLIRGRSSLRCSTAQRTAEARRRRAREDRRAVSTLATRNAQWLRSI
jgi:acyl-CoA synthetase (NDP forming)